ncbi:MAG: response regulator [Lachnospiraceae bacterium]|nr:response regulator [Lachnospiraceae bacterium]
MLKVMIADDEERICKLIQALVDWDSMGMEVAGIAHNGLEAIEMAKSLRPEILITDIQMPGCSGLELIEAVKKSNETLEIIIISGYAHFEYAQRAIKFGVGDYLLKPINKSELHATLQKLKGRVTERKESATDMQQLLQKSENDIRRLQEGLMGQLAEGREIPLSLETMRSEYYLRVECGLFQAFRIQIDGKTEEMSESGMTIVMDKVRNMLERNLHPRCCEMIFYWKNTACIGMMNYKESKRQEIKRSLKDCLNQLEAQKNLYGPITFSASVGSAVGKPEDLPLSIREAAVIIQERLLRGTGRVLDGAPAEGRLHEQNLLEKYLRLMTHAIEVISVEEADAVIDQIKSSIEGAKTVYGYELSELVRSCGHLFLSQLELAGREQEIQRFEERCERCGSMEELFGALRALQRSHLEELEKKREETSIRPIRQAKQYIQNHFSEQITMEEVSSVVGLSSAYFSVLFKKSEGEGFARYLINLRMEEAKRLLRESNIPAAEICRKVGYNDLKHFTHTFEKATGVKPATYRKLYG